MSPSDVALPNPSPRRTRARAAWDLQLHEPLSLAGSGDGAPESWFLGPRAENAGILIELIAASITSHADARRAFHPEDPSHLTPKVRASPEFVAGMDRLRRETHNLLDKLRLSAPFASMRYQGHMLWDVALPATIGQFAAGLYNQNNVAAEASPVTTRLEVEVGNDLCRMLGYNIVTDPSTAPGQTVGWGHLTSGGTVANIEALWAARNLKYAGVALRAAIREVPLLARARGLEVPLWGGQTARLIDLDTWTLLNLDLDALAGLPAALAGFGIAPDEATEALAAYSLQNVGLLGFYRSFMTDLQEPPVFLVAATGHYSWPKTATLLGLGQNACMVQRVDMDARLDLEHVEVTLDKLLRRRTPVLGVVAVIGSTEESAVDPLTGLLDLRERFKARGLNFAIHADAAWGGYFRAMLREGDGPCISDGIPTISMSDYVRAQYEALGRADSITVDPHKGGYIPYPAGALCYRNSAFRDSISLRAPVVFHSQTEPTVGIYGVEGSKPGSAAAAVWLAHRVIRPDRSGYGRILGQCMWTSKRLFCRLATLDDPRFGVTLFNRTPAERRRATARAITAERAMLRRFAELNNNLRINLMRISQFMGVGFGIATLLGAAQAHATLHGFCTGTTAACIDNGTNTPISDHSPQFGFTSSPGERGDFRIEILVPNNVTNATGLTFSISERIGSTALTTTSATLFSQTAWTAKQLDSYLQYDGASPSNPIGAYLPSTQKVDAGATGFYVYQANLPSDPAHNSTQLAATGDDTSIGPILTLNGSLATGGYLLAFLEQTTTSTNMHTSKTTTTWDATANSGAIFEQGSNSSTSVPEPATFGVLGAALGLLGMVSTRRAKRTSRHDEALG